MAVLVAVASVVFIIEAQVPLPVPVPGAKLGLANAVTLFALFYGADKERGEGVLSAVDVFLVLVCRIVLGAVFSGRFTAFVYSVCGGFLAFAAQVIIKKVVSVKQIWACGAIGATFHNVGQIGAAVVVIRSWAVVAYLPVLIIVGIVSGVVTGLVAQFSLSRIGKVWLSK